MLFLATQLAVIATGLVAGVFLTFSDFVMRSLSASEAIAGAEAMQEINRKVYGSIFLTLPELDNRLSVHLLAVDGRKELKRVEFSHV